MNHDRIYPQNIAELFRLAAERYQDRPAFLNRHGKENWEPLSYRKLYESGLSLATALIDLGVEPRGHVGLFADNRREWILADCAIQLCGAADVPRAADLTDDELVYIINHAGIRVAFVETDHLQQKILALQSRIPQLKSVILMDPSVTPAENVLRIGELIEAGANLRESENREVEKRMAGIRPDDLFTLIYTSGTTGMPKGVMLTHANMISQIETIPLNLSQSDRILSILPVWHIFERIFEVLAVSCGAATYYSSIRNLGDDLRQVSPTFMGSAPRLWESLHQRILKSVDSAPPVRRMLFNTAYSIGQKFQESEVLLNQKQLRLDAENRQLSPVSRLHHQFRRFFLKPLHFAGDRLVFRKIRQNIGGALKATISGGGALPAEIDHFFNNIGIPVLEGYGLTETSPVLSVRTLDDLVVGTVGPPIPKTEIRIVDVETDRVLFPNPEFPGEGRGIQGEICVRGPQVMAGYYRDAESTAAVFRDGWFRTGDLGMVTFNDCLKIVGRCKDTIVLRSGENLEPTPIEMRLLQSPLIAHCMVVGQDQRFIGALIVPNPDGFQEIGISAGSLPELISKPETEKRIETEIRSRISAANGFKPFEYVRAFRLISEPFQVGDELTRLFKLKRHVVDQKYKDLIESMFP